MKHLNIRGFAPRIDNFQLCLMNILLIIEFIKEMLRYLLDLV